VEKRAWPRFRSEVVVGFFDGESEAAGLTWDVSVGGMFIRTSRMPEVGSKLMVRMRFSEDRQLLVQGRVVRSFQAPPLVRHLFPTGFGLEISGSELYRNYVRSVEAKAAVPRQA
jgi:Tfp pilus assembly protein PilZ